jgi:ferredoxin
VCPVVVPNEFDAGLTYRKAIYTPMGETLPEPWVINIDDCLNTPPNYLPCNRCIEVCEDDAIFFNLPLETVHKHQVGAVILAPGFQIEGGADFSELGYGTHPDILMSAELQRLLESPGPTGGYASKPSNEEYPESVLLVVDDPSQFALYIIASQVHQLGRRNGRSAGAVTAKHGQRLFSRNRTRRKDRRAGALGHDVQSGPDTGKYSQRVLRKLFGETVCAGYL